MEEVVDTLYGLVVVVVVEREVVEEDVGTEVKEVVFVEIVVGVEVVVVPLVVLVVVSIKIT